MTKPIIYWIRRDLRIQNNTALKFAIESNQPVIPVFIKDEFVDKLGAAPKWRLSLGLGYLAKKFKKYGIDADYSIIEASDEKLPEIIKKIRLGNYSGINVTLPFKQKIINHIKFLYKLILYYYRNIFLNFGPRPNFINMFFRAKTF